MKTDWTIFLVIMGLISFIYGVKFGVKQYIVWKDGKKITPPAPPTSPTPPTPPAQAPTPTEEKEEKIITQVTPPVPAPTPTPTPTEEEEILIQAPVPAPTETEEEILTQVTPPAPVPAPAPTERSQIEKQSESESESESEVAERLERLEKKLEKEIFLEKKISLENEILYTAESSSSVDEMREMLANEQAYEQAYFKTHEKNPNLYGVSTEEKDEEKELAIDLAKEKERFEKDFAIDLAKEQERFEKELAIDLAKDLKSEEATAIAELKSHYNKKIQAIKHEIRKLEQQTQFRFNLAQIRNIEAKVQKLNRTTAKFSKEQAELKKQYELIRSDFGVEYEQIKSDFGVEIQNEVERVIITPETMAKTTTSAGTFVDYLEGKLKEKQSTDQNIPEKEKYLFFSGEQRRTVKAQKQVHKKLKGQEGHPRKGGLRPWYRKEAESTASTTTSDSDSEAEPTASTTTTTTTSDNTMD